jgi:hypothetical protein
MSSPGCYWECGDFAINPELPPLLKLIAAWPLHSRRLWTPPPACGSAVTSNSSFHRWANLLMQNQIDKTVMPARMAAATCSLALACVVYLAGIEFLGLAAGLIALLLTVIEPNLIARGSLVTTDMAVTLAFLQRFAHYFARTKPARGRASCALRLHWAPCSAQNLLGQSWSSF